MLGCYADAIRPGTFTLEGGQTATGSIVNWYREHLAGNEQTQADRAQQSIFAVLDEKAAAIAPGCDGLVCLDHWQGARSPLKDTHSRGLWWGLTLAHGPGHMLRSIYEGTAFGTRHILEDLSHHGLRVSRLFAGGGGAKSALWVQIHADACNVPVSLPSETESCALGSAILAAVRCRHYSCLEEAAVHMVRMDRTIQPDHKNTTAYDEGYHRYRAVYEALRPLLHR
jgi:ribulose kinase